MNDTKKKAMILSSWEAYTAMPEGNKENEAMKGYLDNMDEIAQSLLDEAGITGLEFTMNEASLRAVDPDSYKGDALDVDFVYQAKAGEETYSFCMSIWYNGDQTGEAFGAIFRTTEGVTQEYNFDNKTWEDIEPEQSGDAPAQK